MQSGGPADERESAYELFQRGSRMLAERHPRAAALAADRFAAIVDADPLAHYAHFGLGLSRARLGDHRAARRHLRMAVFLKPENESYRQALARLGDAA